MSFKVSVEEARGELKGIIVERSRGFSSWIRFGDLSLRRLLDGIEECCREEKEGRFVKVWEDEERKYRLDRRVNGAGRFVLCSVLDLESKRFCLVFPEGKGLLGRWVTLAEKLRSLGVITCDEAMTLLIPAAGRDKKSLDRPREFEKRAFLDVARASAGRVGDALWLQLGGREMWCKGYQLGLCLFGRWGEGSILESKLVSLKR